MPVFITDDHTSLEKKNGRIQAFEYFQTAKGCLWSAKTSMREQHFTVAAHNALRSLELVLKTVYLDVTGKEPPRNHYLDDLLKDITPRLKYKLVLDVIKELTPVINNVNDLRRSIEPLYTKQEWRVVSQASEVWNETQSGQTVTTATKVIDAAEAWFRWALASKLVEILKELRSVYTVHPLDSEEWFEKLTHDVHVWIESGYVKEVRYQYYLFGSDAVPYEVKFRLTEQSNCEKDEFLSASSLYSILESPGDINFDCLVVLSDSYQNLSIFLKKHWHEKSLNLRWEPVSQRSLSDELGLGTDGIHTNPAIKVYVEPYNAYSNDFLRKLPTDF